MALSLGIDLDGVSRPASNSFPWASSSRLSLIQRLARSLMQPANSLPYWPGYGFDLRSLCGSNIRPETVSLNVERQFARFEGVARSAVKSTMGSDGTITLNCQIEDAEGVFDFVMSATEAAVKLVSLWGEKITNG